MKLLGSRYKTTTFCQDDVGSLTIFGLFIFLLIIMMSGMAVDLVSTERERVRIQNTIDTAVVAASSLTQANQTQAEVEAMVREHMEKAGYDPNLVEVDSGLVRPDGTTEINSRWVEATVNFQKSTMFMSMVGIDKLPGIASSGAKEGNELIEIALVLDVSGSMSGQKLTDLKESARDFVTTVLSNNSANRTLISIVPYSQQVHMSDDLMTRLNSSFNLDPVLVGLPDDAHPGAVAAYVPGNLNTNCVRFRAEDFENRRLVAGSNIELLSHFRRNGSTNYNKPSSQSRWCRVKDNNGDYIKRPMFLWQNNETALHTYIDSLSAGGWTAIDYGMNWGVGVLDHNFQSVVSGMVDDNVAPAIAEGYPIDLVVDRNLPITADNLRNDVKKYVVLMTDGINTRQSDLKDEFKQGPSRIWFSQEAATEFGEEWGGFIVEMPDNPVETRWYIPGSPVDGGDDQYLPASALDEGETREDAQQWTQHDVFNRFAPQDAANYFFSSSDADAFTAYSNAVNTSLGYNTADTDLLTICDKAREDGFVEIYTVALEAPAAANTILANCSDNSNNHWTVTGSELQAAFAAIASEITKLRLTQ